MIYDDASNRTWTKADYTDQHVGSRTQSKIHNMNNLSIQNLYFPELKDSRKRL
jgi:hypothetical protein